MKRGQVALEFIFIILIILVYLFTTTQPIINNAQGITSDIQKMAMANNEAQKLANTITKISFLGVGSKETIQTFLPIDANRSTQIICANQKIGFIVKLSVPPYPGQCSSGVCDKNFLMPQGITLTCGTSTIIGQQKIVVTKTSPTNVTITQGS